MALVAIGAGKLVVKIGFQSEKFRQTGRTGGQSARHAGTLPFGGFGT